MSDPLSIHVPVLASEVLAALDPHPGQRIVDATLGGGGHTRLLIQQVAPGGEVIGVDCDPHAIARAERELAGSPLRVAQANYRELPEVLAAAGISRVHGILLDLGLSSDQLADEKRGFSYDANGPLDLRFDPQRGEPAWRLLERLSAQHLADIIYQFGEERYSRRIARRIVEQRRGNPIRGARDLSELVRRCVPRSRNHPIDPATRTFQALRIAVNDELESLEVALRRLPDCLLPGGKLAIISFHSLEDRRVKQAFRGDSRLQPLVRKPIRATSEETRCNARSRSARLRVAERVAE
ncbi:MAG: 16S rRNA (cytosine(1402)-N(4))-methyltransferase RsmH [Planctomycetota bacterium]